MPIAGRCLCSLGGDIVLYDPETTRVVGRHVFYNGSTADGSDPGANPGDDAAIDASVELLGGGEPVSAANISGYAGGLNGIMVDIRAAADCSGDAQWVSSSSCCE